MLSESWQAGGNRISARLNFRLRQIIFVSILTPLVGLAAFLMPTGSLTAQQQQGVSVSLGVGDTVLVAEGDTSPLAHVTMLSNGSVIGTATANNNGFFSRTFPAQEPGLRNLKIYARDSAGQLTDTVTKNVNIVEHGQTTVNIFMPPSIELTKLNPIEGQSFKVLGETTPNSTVIVRIDNNLSLKAKSNGEGRWQVNINTAGFFIGTHSLFAAAQKDNGSQSEPTAKRQFRVNPRPTERPTAQPPEQIFVPPPVIVFPPNNYHTASVDLTIRGTSLLNAQIEIWNFDEIIGSTFANHRGEWSLDLLLSQKEYKFRARACINLRCSEFSKPVEVSFIGAAEEDYGRIFRLGQYRYYDIFVDDPIRLDIFTRSLQTPYELVVDWGDEVVSVSTVEHSRPIELRHSYDEIGHYNGIVTIKDNRGFSASKYFSVEVVKAPSGIASQLLAFFGAVWTYFITATGTTPLLLRTGLVFVISAFRYVEDPKIDALP